MKIKTFIFFLVTILFFIYPVQAETTSKAMQISLGYYPTPKGYKLISNKFENKDGLKWNVFKWVNIKNKYDYYVVRVSSDGNNVVYNLNYPKQREQKYQIDKALLYDEVHTIVNSWISKHFPKEKSYLQETIATQMREDVSLRRPMKKYYFRFEQLINGLPDEDYGLWVSATEDGIIYECILKKVKRPKVKHKVTALQA